MPARPLRRESHAVFERLLRGEATASEYVAALKRDVASERKAAGPRSRSPKGEGHNPEPVRSLRSGLERDGE